MSSFLLDWGDGETESILPAEIATPFHRLKFYSVDPTVATISLQAVMVDGSTETLSERDVEIQVASPTVTAREDQGLLVELFDNAGWFGPATTTRIDPSIRFDFGDRGPVPGIGDDGSAFTMIWRGDFTPSHAGDHSLFAKTGPNDQIKVLLDGIAVIDTLGNPTEIEQSSPFSWEGGNPIQLEIQYLGGTGTSSVVVGTESDRTFKLPLESKRLVPSQSSASLRNGLLMERFLVPSVETIAELRSTDAFRSNIPFDGSDIQQFRSIGEVSSEPVGKRFRGFVAPQISGAYTFHLAASSEAELWLSRGDDSVSVRRIASVDSAGEQDDFAGPHSSASVEIELLAGERYYVEAVQLHEDAEAPDHLSVGWTIPGNDSPQLIDAEFLQPVTPVVTIHADNSQTSESQPGHSINRFRVQRSDDLGRDLEVKLTFGGTATPGLDYEAQTGSVIIPAGVRSLEVAFETLPDTIDETDETIRIQLAADPRYQLGLETTREIRQTIMTQLVEGDELLPQAGTPIERFDYAVNNNPTENVVTEIRVDDVGLPFVDGNGSEANAIRVDVNSFSSPFDILFAHDFTTEEIIEGEKYFAALWARSAREGELAQVGMRFQETETFAGSEDSWIVGNEWTPIYFPIVADFEGNSTAGRGLDIRLGYREQTVEFAGLSLRRLPDATDLNSLPRNIFSYEGRGADAAWRDAVVPADESATHTPTRIQIVDPAGNPISGARVTMVPKRPRLPIGMSISPSLVVPGEEAFDLPDSLRYRNIVDNYFQSVTDGGEAQWGPWLEDPVLPTDFLDWAIDRGKDYHGHAIIWGEMDTFPAPESLLADYELQLATTSAEEAKGWLKNEVLTHVVEGPAAVFSGSRDESESSGAVGQEPKVQWWDAINHPILSRDIWEITGDDFMIEVLLSARSVVHPDTKLTINENRPLVDPGGERSNRFLALLTELDSLAENGTAEYDTIGFQAHFQSQILPSIESISAELDRFRAFDREIQITEFDLDTLLIDEQTQVDFSRDFHELLAGQPDVTKFTPWGFWEGAHWRSHEGAHLFNQDWTARPSGQLLLEQLATEAMAFTTDSEPLDISLAAGDYKYVLHLPSGAIVEVDSEEICNEGICEVMVGNHMPGRGVLGSELPSALKGNAFLMHTIESVSQRFSSLPSVASEHVVLVRYMNGEWMYDNNRGYESFTPWVSDRLIASIDLGSREVELAAGQNRSFNGIRFGYQQSDLEVTPNRWSSVENFGEFEVAGSYFVFPATAVEGALIGNTNKGVLGLETAVGRRGEAYFLYTEQPVQERFESTFPTVSEHLILVRHLDGQWVYDNNSTYLPFIPEQTDRLVARVDLADRSVDLQEGLSSVFRGIRLGFTQSDLMISPNVWSGAENYGEFGVAGSYIDFATDAETVTATTEAVDVFLMIGQSNAAGRASASELSNQQLAAPYDGNLLYSKLELDSSTLNTRSHTGLVDLQPHQYLGAMNVGPEITLGRHLDEISLNDAALVSFVSGGSGIRNFIENGSLHEPMLQYLQDIEEGLALKGYSRVNWKALFVVTGEGDSLNETRGRVFAQRLLELRDSIHTDPSVDAVPLIWSQLKANWLDTPSYNYSELNEGANLVNAAVIDLAADIRGVTVTQSNADLDTRFSSGVSSVDGIHYSADAYAAIGDRLFAAYMGRDVEGGLPGPVTINPGKGIAATDNAVGTGFLMYSHESVHERFPYKPFSSAADHIIAVVYDTENERWLYDNNSALFEFDPRLTDYLVAEVDFDANTVTSLEGASGEFKGIRVGYAAGDLVYHAEMFGGLPNAGEIWIDGGWIAQPELIETLTIDREGEVAFREDIAGIGYALFSQQPLFDPFNTDLDTANTSGFLVVFYDEATEAWMADNGNQLVNYEPAPSDRIVAKLDFDARSAILLRQPSLNLNGIRSGFADSNLTVEFQSIDDELSLSASGTFIQFFD